MGTDRTPCLVRKSFDNGDDIIFLRICEGALKWRFRDLRAEEDTNGLTFIIKTLRAEIRLQ